MDTRNCPYCGNPWDSDHVAVKLYGIPATGCPAYQTRVLGPLTAINSHTQRTIDALKP